MCNREYKCDGIPYWRSESMCGLYNGIYGDGNLWYRDLEQQQCSFCDSRWFRYCYGSSVRDSEHYLHGDEHIYACLHELNELEICNSESKCDGIPYWRSERMCGLYNGIYGDGHLWYRDLQQQQCSFCDSRWFRYCYGSSVRDSEHHLHGDEHIHACLHELNEKMM